uniref:L1 transposable element RRM domain-containing protein n=1 Tax=Erpetoichthys calabaricus TaxID=27687 RepID=A0A8C4RGJ5_ERPCA
NDGNVLTSEESVLSRWKEYFERLMNEENEREKRLDDVEIMNQEVQRISKEEVRTAMKRMKNGGLVHCERWMSEAEYLVFIQPEGSTTAYINMVGKKGAQKEMEKKTKAASKPRPTSPSSSSRYGLSEADLEQMGECPNSSGPRSTASSPVESEMGSECASDKGYDSSPIGEDNLKLEMALQSALSPTPREPGTLAVIEPAASRTVLESRNDLSELKVMIAELKQEIKNDIKKREKASEKLRRELQELRQDNKDSEKRVYIRFDAAFNGMLDKIEEHIQENTSKLSTFDNQALTTRIEIAENLASTADGKATAASSECKKLGDRLAALEDGSRRNNIRIEGLPENRESPNPVKFAAELISKIIGEDFKSDTEIAAAYCIRGSNTFRLRTFIVCFEKLQSKLNVMSLLRQKRENFENNLIRIFPDFSPSTAAKRASFYNIKQHLRKANIRYSLLYPAKLKVEIQGKDYIFTSREETDKELRKLIPTLSRNKTVSRTLSWHRKEVITGCLIRLQ